MRFRQSSEEKEAQAITRLVDEPGTPSAQAGGWADRPEVRRQIASERRVADALRTGGPAVPDRLVQSIDAKVRQAYGSAAPRPRRSRLVSGSAWRPAVALGGLAAVIAAIVVVAIGVSGSSGGPSIPAAAELAFAPSTGPAPAVSSAQFIDASYGGVTFPNYGKFSVPATGQRTDRIGGRSALTIFYRLPDGTPLSYTVFSGNAVPLPSGVRNVTFEGVPLREFNTSSGLSVVTLVRHGRTCVLAAKTAPDKVLALAAAPVLAQRSA